jgi:hypothetical protein
VRAGLFAAVGTYLLYSSFGIAAPFWWGHHGYHGATYMLRARTSLRLHMLAPATWTGFDPPPQNALYFHHPIGYHHLLTVLVPIFGEHEWLARGLAVAGGLLALWALYALVRQEWSREAGLVAVVVYVCLPVLTSFSVLSDPMLLALACVAWSLKAYLAHLRAPSRRALVEAALAYALGGLLMWEAFFIAPFIAVHAFAYGFTLRGQDLKMTLGRFRVSALWAHTLTIGAACVLVMGFHVWFTHHANAWDEFLESYKIRHAAPSAQYVIDRHTQWVEILFGAPPVVVGAAWFFVWLSRLAAGRARRRDLAPLTFLYVNTLYIYMFAEGSSVHLYRVFFYSGFFALATTDLVVEIHRAVGRLVRGRALQRLPIATLSAAIALGLYLYAEVPHAYANLIESRVLMGTHSEPNYSPQAEKLFFAREVTRRTKPTDRVISVYGNLGSRKEMWYYLDRSLDEIQSLTSVDTFKKTWSKSVVIFDERLLSAQERSVFERLIREHPVSFFDRYTMIDLRSNQPGETAYSFVPGPRSRAYSWFVSHKYPPLQLRREGYLPGICAAIEAGVPVARDEALPAPPPTSDLRARTCWVNYLTERGEPVREQVRAAMELTTAVGALPSGPVPLGDASVHGAGVDKGRLRVLIHAGGREVGDLRYQIVRVGSPVAATPAGAVITLPRSAQVPSPSTWRTGRLYLDELLLGKLPVQVTLELWRPAAVKKPVPLVFLRPPDPATEVVERASLGIFR